MLNYNRSAGAKLIITGVFISNAISGMNLMRMRALAGIAGRSQNFTSTGPLHLSAQNTQAMRLGSLSQNNFAQRLLQSAGSYNNDYSWKNNRQTNQTNHSWFGRLCFALGFGATYTAYQEKQNKIVYAQETENIFHSQILDKLQQMRDKNEKMVLTQGKNDSLYALEILDGLLNGSDKPFYASHDTCEIASLIKHLSEPEYVEMHHPEFYQDVMILIFKAYANATPKEQSILNEKIQYFFSGVSNHERHLTKKLEDVLAMMLEQTINSPKEHEILQTIVQVVKKMHKEDRSSYITGDITPRFKSKLSSRLMEGVENIHSPKAYAKSLFSGEQGRCYSCNEFLNFAHYRDGSYFEPEDRERYYTECAESYPRAAEASILKLFQSPFGEAEAYEYIALLTNKNFEFSPEFKAAVTRQLNASMGKIIDSVVFEAKNINGKTIDIFDEIEYKQRRPNCEEMETFVKEYGSDELAKQIMPLCALKKQFAPPLIPR